MKRSLVLLAALAAGALLGMAASAPAALAQQPQPAEFSTFELFAGPESIDLNSDALQRLADAIRKAQTPGSCPLGRLKIRVAEGDPLFQKALMQSRRDAALAHLQQMGVPVAGRLFVETEMFGGPEGHDTVYENWRDRTPPTLRTTSVPPKGTKVQPGDVIRVTMTARDDADRWQTGVKTIQLVADSEGGRFIASENYEPCSDPKEKRVEATYTVPADPPPIVRLTALAEDHSDHLVQESAEFPTGDFYGTFTMVSFTVGRDGFRARADIVLNHDGKGNLTGTMVGQHEHVDYSTGACFHRMVQPNRFRVSLVGFFTERSAPATAPTIKVFIREIQETALTAEARCESGTGGPVGPPGGWKFKTGVFPPEVLLGTPGPLGDGEVLPDGTRQYRLVSETGGVGTRWAVTLRRTRN